MQDFNSFELLPSILEEIANIGHTIPTPIQEKSIPSLLNGSDLLGIAQTGSGKTAAFSLPLIDRLGREEVQTKPNNIRSLILAPTRELSSQIQKILKLMPKG
jgi:ATP-dependent RNA helicase RhlE